MPAAPYQKPPALQDPRATRQLLKAIWFMLLATLLLVGGCLRLIDRHEAPEPSPAALAPFAVVLLISIAMVALALLCRRLTFRAARQSPDGSVRPQRYFVGTILAMALCEAPVMISLMAGFLFDAQRLFGLAAMVGFVGLLLLYPSGRAMRNTRSAGDPERDAP